MSTGTLRTASDREWTVLSGDVTFPRRGIWTARVDVDADEDDPLPSGACTLILAGDNDDDPVEIVGTIVEVDLATVEGRATATIVAGKGKLAATLLEARTYQQAPLEVPLSSLVSDAIEGSGEVLDDDVALVGLIVPRWHRVGGRTAAMLLDRLAELKSFTWRFSDDGRVQIVIDEWLEADVEDAGLFLDGADNVIERTILGTVSRASIRPGTTARGRRIEEVVYTLDELGLRVMLRWGDGEGVGGLRGDLEMAARRAMPEFAYHCTHEVTVRRQLPDGTLDVDADNPIIGGLTSVPYYPGVIVCRMNIAEGTRALLSFINGDESKPAIVGFVRFEINPLLRENAYAIARVNDSVAVGSLTFTAAPDGSGGIASIAVTYTPPKGPNQMVAIVPSTPVTINLAGIIQNGSPEVFLRAGN